MVDRIERETRGRQHSVQESEPQPRVVVVMHGFDHQPLNLQAIPVLLADFRDHFQQTRGRTILYLENAGLTEVDAAFWKRSVESHGFEFTFVRNMLQQEAKGRKPGNTDVRQRIKAIHGRANLDELLAKELIPDMVNIYMLDKGLDEVRAACPQKPLTVEYESHLPIILEQEGKIAVQYRFLYGETFDHWDKRNFDRVVATHRQACSFNHTSGIRREPEMIEKAKKLIDVLLREKDGGLLYIMGGFTHTPMVDKIKKGIDPSLSVLFLVKGDSRQDSAEGQIAKAVRDKEALDDVVYARDFLARLLLETTAESYVGQGRVDYFASRYEDHARAIYHYVNTLSLEDIRKFCEEGTANAFVFVNEVQTP